MGGLDEDGKIALWPEEFDEELAAVREIGQRVALFAQLRFVGLENGWKPGWAAVFFKSIYEVWPDREWEKVPPMRPTELTWALVENRQRSFRNSMKEFYAERRAEDERRLEDSEATGELYGSEESTGDVRDD
jgi:hypothetical protein